MSSRFSEELMATIQDLAQKCYKLQQQEQLCRESGKYAEAEIVKTKLNSAEKELKNKQLEQMAQRHFREIEDARVLYEQELAQLTKKWDEIQELARKDKIDGKRQMQRRFHAEQKQVRQELQGTIPQRGKDSIELMNLKRMEHHMAKQKQYTQASHVQSKIADLQKFEDDQYSESRSNRIQSNINQLKARQNQEINQYMKKLQQLEEKNAKNRHLQQQNLLQRFLNFKKDTNAKQQRQRQLFKGQLTTKALVSGSSSVFKN